MPTDPEPPFEQRTRARSHSLNIHVTEADFYVHLHFSVQPQQHESPSATLERLLYGASHTASLALLRMNDLSCAGYSQALITDAERQKAATEASRSQGYIEGRREAEAELDDEEDE